MLQQNMSDFNMHKKYKSPVTFSKINEFYPQSFVDELDKKTQSFSKSKEFNYSEEDDDSFSKVKIMQNHMQNKTTIYKPGSGLYLVHDTEAQLNPERLKELADPVKQVEEPVAEKAESLKDCLEVHKEPESKKYERRSLREDLGLTEKSEQKE